MVNELPNGFCLRLYESCQLEAKRKVISTHRTQDEAEAKAKSLGYDLRVFEILDIYTTVHLPPERKRFTLTRPVFMAGFLFFKLVIVTTI